MPFHPTTDKFATAFSLHTKRSQQKPLHHFKKSKDQTNKQIYNNSLPSSATKLSTIFERYMMMKSPPYKGIPCFHTLPLYHKQKKFSSMQTCSHKF